jgi:hypothetical protein
MKMLILNEEQIYAQVLVNLSRLPVLPQQSAQHSLSPHPLYFCGHASFGGTLPLTGTSVTTLALCSEEVAGACS